MANDYFHFKQFSIFQDRCAMKVGTDGVLLGAWVGTEGVQKALDIGTGTGLIALMLAQRTGADIDAVEMDRSAALQAGENFKASPWRERIQLFHQPYQEFAGNGQVYDLIVTNPPFFAHSVPAVNHERSLARHHVSLTLNDLMVCVVTQLTNKGRLGLIYPYDDFAALEELAASLGLFLIRKTEVIPAPGKRVKRVLAELSKEAAPTICQSLILEEFGRHRYSEAYKSLTRDFYQTP